MKSEKKKNIIATLLTIAGFLLVWQLVSMAVDNAAFLPKASVIVLEFFKTFVNPVGKYTMTMHILISLYRVGVAFILATLVGIMMGVGMGYSKLVEAILYPLFEIIRPIPPLAWIPMSILWFGLGDASKFFIIFLGSFSFITLNTYDGTKNVDRELIGAARMLGASERQVFFKVVLPSSVPYIFAGLQIAVTAGWSSVVGAEMVRSDEGVGWLIVMGMNKGNTIQIMVGMLAIGIIGFLLAQLTTLVERRLLAWNDQ
ncbi:ABC transporter permease [Vagococcus elongatus]|uniref:Taurine ABC transporter permease n=1 Tax=Vagococcus elongatus TaxID=180344 RepID=A0A430AHS5_9ENTE|nr:ABC transporter permease [Vagococcus elongatus]RSU07652.1 taurine ABC transporter permease [Vagococcus elongatus]